MKAIKFYTIKYLISTSLLILISYVSFAQADFPKKDSLNGYKYAELHARKALSKNGSNSIWIKGSRTKNQFKLIEKNTNKLLVSAELLPPFYTNVLNFSSSQVVLQFCSENNNCIDFEEFEFNCENSKEFSMLLYGCFEPFNITEKDDKLITGIYQGDKNSSHRMRKFFNELTLGKNFNQQNFKKSWNGYEELEKDSTEILAKPALIIGTGDQVYVDGFYGKKVKKGKHPLSAWEDKAEPLPIICDENEYITFLNQLYNASYSFTDLEKAHNQIPSVHVIDDHELRDGWGSQGDEYKNGVMTSELKTHYNLGKRAYIQHQLIASGFNPDSIKGLITENKSMEFSFQINGINGFVMDLRSKRSVDSETVLGEKQWRNFENWMDDLEPNQEIVLVLSIPLSMRPMKGIEKLTYLLIPSLKDDLRDSWSAAPNRKDRDRLISILTKHRITKGIKPIIASGNIHKASITEIWVNPEVSKTITKEGGDGKFILAYEIISSGISHAGIESSSQRNSIADITESQRIGKIESPFDYEDKSYSYFPVFRIAVAEQNFGAIEFKEDKTEISTFFYNRFTEKIEQYYLKLDWDISFEESEKQRVVAKKDKKSKSTIAPLPEGRWIVE